MTTFKRNGFTLVELLLVIAISTVILSMFLGYTVQRGQEARRDKTIMQIQQVLNAALSFYNQNGRWPSATGNLTQCANTWCTLQTGGELVDQNYIPRPIGGTVLSPYAAPYFTAWNTNNNNFYVISSVQTNANAQVIAGQLPFGFVTPNNNPPNTTTPTACSAPVCNVVTAVPPPGQNLANARSVNFASIYHASSCVPAPTCPTGMIPQIFVVPTSVSGINDPPTGCTNNTTAGCTANVYPISSYTAYAVGYVTTPPGPGTTNPAGYGYIGAPFYYQGGATMPSCNRTNPPNKYAFADSCFSHLDNQGGGTASPTGYYWRVCLGIVTERGAVTPDYVNGQPSPWGLLQGSVMAITRCVPGSTTTGTISEPAGSDFTVFSPYGN